MGYRLTRNKDYEGSIKFISKINKIDVSIRDYVLFYLALSYSKTNRCQEARETLEELIADYPESRWVLLAKKQLKQKEECPDFNAAENFAIPSPECHRWARPQKRADCFFEWRRYAEAKEIYRSLTGTGKGLKNLVRLSQAAARSQDFETALWANQQILEKHPRSKEAFQALRKIAFLYQDQGRYPEALLVLDSLVQTTKNSSEKRHFLEKMGWCFWRINRYGQAIDSFDEALGHEETPFALYWKGRSLKKLGQRTKALEIFVSLADIYRENYYVIRAVEQLVSRGSSLSYYRKRHWWRPKPLGKIRWIKQRQILPETRELKRIDELKWIGLMGEAEGEIRRFRKEFHMQPVLRYRLVAFEDTDYALPHADFIFSEMGLTSPEGATRAPIIDPFLIYAMMRQESRFQPHIVSPAGAIGILQIMPATARRLALEEKWSFYEPEWLYEPMTNIELGIRYLQKLHRLFPHRWDAVVASYNAGEQAVERWLTSRQGISEEEFIEEIPYSETKNYVKKVYTNWQAYRTIYRY